MRQWSWACTRFQTEAFVGQKLLSKVKERTLEKIYGPAFVVAIAMGLAMLL